MLSRIFDVFFEAVQNTRSTCFIGFKNTRLRLVFLNPIKHCCSCFKQSLKKSVFSTFPCLETHKNDLRRPGIEPGSTAWKAAMLTTIPPTRGWLILQFHFDLSENYLLQWSTCLTNKLQTNTVSRLLNKILVKVEIGFYWFCF